MSEVKRNDREHMADDLQRLGLFAIANDVRASRKPIDAGVRHVRDYGLPRTERGIRTIRQRNAESPPIPGTVGASMLPNCEARRDALKAFLDDWFTYDTASAQEAS